MSGPLDMGGHIDDVFASPPVVVKAFTQGHRDAKGHWVPGQPIEETYTATTQPLSWREADNLLRAGVRLLDARKVYINSGDLEKLIPVAQMEFLGQRWRIVQTDIRPWRTYAKIVVSRFDEQT